MHGLWEALQVLGIYRPIFFLDGEEQINYNKQFIQHMLLFVHFQNVKIIRNS